MSWSWRPRWKMGAAQARIAAAISLPGPAVSIREVFDGGGLAALVDEVETTEVDIS
jgi:hypothetical protein